jgi:hypothetical protein
MSSLKLNKNEDILIFNKFHPFVYACLFVPSLIPLCVH